MDWIACAERMPELTQIGRWGDKTSDAVLVYLDTGIMDVRLKTGIMDVLRLEPAGWSYEDGALIRRGRVSHWMPLPPAPVAQIPQEATHAE